MPASKTGPASKDRATLLPSSFAEPLRCAHVRLLTQDYEETYADVLTDIESVYKSVGGAPGSGGRSLGVSQRIMSLKAAMRIVEAGREWNVRFAVCLQQNA